MGGNSRNHADAGDVTQLLIKEHRPEHVDAAAWAAVLAIEKPCRGIYNIAEPSGYLSTEKARRDLGFNSGFRLSTHA